MSIAENIHNAYISHVPLVRKMYRFFDPIHGVLAEHQNSRTMKFVQYFEFFTCCYFPLILSHETLENITCVWHVTYWYLWSIHKLSRVKVWTTNWDNYIAKYSYQDTFLGSFVFKGMLICFVFWSKKFYPT